MSLLAATVGAILVVQQVGRHTSLEYRYTSIGKPFAERQVLYQCLSKNGGTGTRFCTYYLNYKSLAEPCTGAFVAAKTLLQYLPPPSRAFNKKSIRTVHSTVNEPRAAGLRGERSL